MIETVLIENLEQRVLKLESNEKVTNCIMHSQQVIIECLIELLNFQINLGMDNVDDSKRMVN